jgi:glycosyltransferase involved in cell wall biosynthesis
MSGSHAAEPARILEICTYPPPRGGWSMRVELIKKALESQGHECVVLNTGRNRFIPSPDYETLLGPWDFVRKVWRYSRAGFTVHEHINGESAKGFVRVLLAELLNLCTGRRCYLTFHAGTDQQFFPRHKAPALVPLYWLIFTIPSRIVCNSPAVKACIVEYGIDPHKIIPIPAFTRQYLDFTPVALSHEIESFMTRFPLVIFTYIRVRPTFNLQTLIEGFALIAKRRPDVGLLFVGVSDDIDAELWADVEQRIERHGLRPRMCIVEEFDHDQFLTGLTRCACYLRTPTSDGVASSVLEALALGVPTVAAENGTRPPGVITFNEADPKQLAERVLFALDNRDEVASSLPRPVIPDTLNDEVRLLTGALVVNA